MGLEALSVQGHTELAFLLTRQWRDTPGGVELVFWARADSGPIRVHLDRRQAVCFIERGVQLDPSVRCRRQELELRTLDGLPVDGLYFRKRSDLVEARKRLAAEGIRIYESDIKPSERHLMERFIAAGMQVTGAFEQHERYRTYRNPMVGRAEYGPSLSVLSIDIETSGYEEGLYSIAATGREGARAFLHRSPTWKRFGHDESVELSVHSDEISLLESFFSYVQKVDPDVLIGWNVIDYDLRVLERVCQRLGLGFGLGRGGERAALLEPSSPTGKRVARIPGRAVLDGIDTLRTATWAFEDFGLEFVARELLGRGKLIHEEEHRLREIRRMYLEEPEALVRYNVEDCRLVEEIFARTRLMEFAVERARLTGLAIDRVGGSVAAFDNLYLPRLHRRGRVARDVEDRSHDGDSPGGYVMSSRPGLFDNVIVLDFKSLYPSIIRTFRVDPLGLAEAGDDAIEGFRGARFSRDEHILPGLIAELWAERDNAKRSGNEALSRAIKIIMNSFYGVLGTHGCRFFDPKLAASITLRGHEIITKSREWIEEDGYEVVYGDTDSLFVHLGAGLDESECRAIGAKLAKTLTVRWSSHLRERLALESYLELQFESHYLRFFMPTIRGSEQGSKKRYAGLVKRGAGLELSFTGLESVRSDWTPLAREFQREVFRRVLMEEPFEEYVRSTADELFAGKRDRDLVYRKRLRRRVEDYQKNVPPHAQAAKKSSRRSRWIRYVMTTNGPEPIDNQQSPLDYQHYLDRQLAPAADAILHLQGTSVASILDAQLKLF